MENDVVYLEVNDHKTFDHYNYRHNDVIKNDGWCYLWKLQPPRTFLMPITTDDILILIVKKLQHLELERLILIYKELNTLMIEADEIYNFGKNVK